MLSLFIFAFIGIVFHFLLSGQYTKANAIEHAIYVVFAAVGAYFGSTANLAGWFLKAVYCAVGFLIPFAVAKLKSISKQA